MKVIISYNEPDMDGVSCMYAYSELLNRLGENTKYFIWNSPKNEVDIVCKLFGIELHSMNENDLSDNDEFVLVDLNGKDQMHQIVKEDNIVEIIDHHSLSKCLPTYMSLKRLQIDRLGAAATIVAERYKESGLIPSRESAILLYYGIISNSINLKASITNSRDIAACEWLKSVCNDISEEKIKEIFIKKSQIDDDNLRTEMECEIPTELNNFKSILAQIEVANVEEFLKEKKAKMLHILQNVKDEKNVDYVLCNCIDILNGYNIILVLDEESKMFVENSLGYKVLEDGTARTNEIIQRKNISAILRKKYN